MAAQQAQECEVCGSYPCYGICPNNDPFHGDQKAENDDYEANSLYDHKLGLYSPAEEPGYWEKMEAYENSMQQAN